MATRTGSPYREILRDAYEQLHPHVRSAHEAPLRATGTLDVVHGSHRLGPLIVRLMHLPRPGTAHPVVLRVHQRTTSPGGHAVLAWHREIGGCRLATTQFARDGRLVEQHGVGRVSFSLAVVSGALMYEQQALHVFGIRLAGRLVPVVNARVAPLTEGWSVDVRVHWRGHLICRYGGCLQPAAAVAS